MAEENPEQEILVDPQWSILEDGLGAQVLAFGGVPFVDNQNRKCIKWRVKPDDYVKKRYKLRMGEELDAQGFWTIITQVADLIPLNIYDDANKKWMYTKSFRHEATDLSQREEQLQSKLDFAGKKILLLQGQVIRLTEQLDDASLNTGKVLEQSAQIAEKYSNITATAISKSREGENKQ